MAAGESGTDPTATAERFPRHVPFPDEPVEYPVFTPDEEAFRKGFRTYVLETVLPDERFKACGVCKIIPPDMWYNKYTEDYYTRRLNRMSVRPVSQIPVGTQGAYQMVFDDQPSLPWALFASVAMSDDRKPRYHSSASLHKVEREFWTRTATGLPPFYGSDMEGTLFDKDDEAWGWNADNLNTDLARLGRSIPGVTQSMLYAGMWRSVFAWHKEDMDLFAVNVLHWGAPKSWWVVPSADAAQFDARMGGIFAGVRNETKCAAFLRHKTSLVNPSLLKGAVRVTRVVQYPGEWILTWAAAYHCGFNHGLNIAESVNFAFPEWIPFGARAEKQRCACNPFAVSFSVQDIYPQTLPKLTSGGGDSADARVQETEEHLSSNSPPQKHQLSSGSLSNQHQLSSGVSPQKHLPPQKHPMSISSSSLVSAGSKRSHPNPTRGEETDDEKTEPEDDEEDEEVPKPPPSQRDEEATTKENSAKRSRAEDDQDGTQQELSTVRAVFGTAPDAGAPWRNMPIEFFPASPSVAILYTDGVPYVARVVAIAPPRFRAHYPGQPHSSDEWIHVDSERFVGLVDSKNNVIKGPLPSED